MILRFDCSGLVTRRAGCGFTRREFRMETEAYKVELAELVYWDQQNSRLFAQIEALEEELGIAFKPLRRGLSFDEEDREYSRRWSLIRRAERDKPRQSA